jgi:hypothetical protein
VIRRGRGIVRALAAPTVALVLVLAFLPGRATVAIRLYALLVAAVLVVVALRALGRAIPPLAPLPAARGSVTRVQPPAALGRLEDEIALGVASAYDYHHRLRLRLHGLAEGLLAARRRIVLDREPEEARRALGEPAWELVRADRRLPDDRLSRGPSQTALAEAVTTLERL